MSTTPKPSVSYAGCGFIGVYQIGATAALRQFAPYLLESDILGSSSGAMLGIGLAAGMSMEEIVRSTLHIANKVSEKVLGPITPAFNLTEVFKEVWEDLLPEDIAERASGRLHISMTKLPEFSNMMVNYFTSKSDVIDALLCTSFIPMVFGWFPPKFRGNLCIDGFYSNNQPILSKETITVTVFAGDASICPLDGDEASNLVNLHFPQGPDSTINVSWNNSIRMGNAVVPPPTKTMLKICTQGFEDAIKYLCGKDLIKCARCIDSASSRPTCGLCDVAKKASLTKTLPEEILKVFEEAIEKEGANERDLSSYIFKLPVSMWQAAFRL